MASGKPTKSDDRGFSAAHTPRATTVGFQPLTRPRYVKLLTYRHIHVHQVYSMGGEMGLTSLEPPNPSPYYVQVILSPKRVSSCKGVKVISTHTNVLRGIVRSRIKKAPSVDCAEIIVPPKNKQKNRRTHG